MSYQEDMMLSSRLAAVAAASLVLSAPTDAQATGQTIIVWSFGFFPRPIVLAAGRPVTLTFQNRSGSSHDFTAKTFFAASRILRGEAADGEVELKPHESRSVTLIPRVGRYTAHCSHFFHKQLGMSNQIYVY
jgi:plastocyanin